MKKIEIGGKKLIIDKTWLTVKKRREIRKKFEKEKLVVAEDKEVLSELKNRWEKKPPTEMEIYEGYLRLRRDSIQQEGEEEEEEFYAELSRAISRWENADGTPGENLTEEEYENLPFDAANFIFRKVLLNGESEKSFLEISPETTSV